MTQTILGVLIGITTSFIAGIFLIWKGDQLVHYIRRLPKNWRLAIFSKAYLIALHSYPYRYAHLITLTIMATTALLTLLAYGILSFVAFNIDLSLPPEEIKKSFHIIADPSWFIYTVLNPWFLLSVTLLLVCTTGRIVFVTVPPELLVPYAHRELSRVRECVAKCGTPEQFFEYTDLEHSAETISDVINLITHAKTIFGNVDLKLAEEILGHVLTDLPVPINDAESQSE
jgi:hypothetical protein